MTPNLKELNQRVRYCKRLVRVNEVRPMRPYLEHNYQRMINWSVYWTPIHTPIYSSSFVGNYVQDRDALVLLLLVYDLGFLTIKIEEERFMKMTYLPQFFPFSEQEAVNTVF